MMIKVRQPLCEKLPLQHKKHFVTNWISSLSFIDFYCRATFITSTNTISFHFFKSFTEFFIDEKLKIDFYLESNWVLKRAAKAIE